ncbi:hypothetical protein SEMRO_1252_G256220.1 [Seminavis robusta]|uniref:Uncharacterized protein n=1 Tax=Seminavis robusta TaxID=568900 RepID=A0A9N8EMB7_9STRA|nr:hypothetical protein SEMRO_1252_G256220.1 [Seminavis robusta]|eukprot:Sro1252_g256220.1 n/a (697) ;mRNA; r:2523-4613
MMSQKPKPKAKSKAVLEDSDDSDSSLERAIQERMEKQKQKPRPGQYGSTRLLEAEINLSSSSSSSYDDDDQDEEEEELKDTPEKPTAQKEDFVDLVSPQQESQQQYDKLSQPDSLSQFPPVPVAAGATPAPKYAFQAFQPINVSTLHPNVQRMYHQNQQETQAEWQRFLDNQCPMPTHLMGFRQSPAPAPATGFSRVPSARGVQLPVQSPVARRRPDSPAAPVMMDSATTKKSRNDSRGRATPTQDGRPPTPNQAPHQQEEAAAGATKKSATVPRKPVELPPKVAAFRYEHKSRLELGEELNKRSKDNPGPFTVAQYIVFGSESRGNYEKFEIDKLSCDQLRKLAVNFGCKGVSSAGKFEIRRRMAIRCTAATAYDNPEIVNNFASARDLKINSTYRLLNTCVHSTYFQRFVDLHANKTRIDHESNRAGPYKQFWIDIADFYNDTENNQELSVIYGAVEEEDERQFDIATAGPINPCNFNKLNHESCCQLVKDAMKAVEKIHAAMKKSGQGSNDPWSFCRKSVLTIRKGVEVSAEVAYYAFRIREPHPQLEGSWDAMLTEDLAASSTATPTASKAPPASSTATPSTASIGSASANDSLISSLGAWNESTRTASEQRQNYINMKTSQAAEERLTRMWNEYDRLSLRVMELRDNGNAPHLLHNLATRVRALEDKLDIAREFSVVYGTDLLSRHDVMQE